LPVENTQDSRARKVWRTGTSSATEYIVGDFGAAKAVTSVIIHAHNLVSGDTDIKFQMNATDSWTTPSFEQVLTRADKTFGAVFASQSYQYFRIVFTKASAGVTRDIGRIFVGTYLEPSRQVDFSGFDLQTIDTSDVEMSIGEDEYADIKNVHAEFTCEFSQLPETDMANITTYYRTVGKYSPHFVQVETTGYSNYYYVRITKAVKQQAVGVAFWKTAVDYKEQVV
jgi:hypothetical protein